MLNGRRPWTQHRISGLQSMHHRESLTHNPNRAYREDAASPPTGDFVTLTPVEDVHGRKKVDLSLSDPSPVNVRRMQEAAARQRAAAAPSSTMSGRSGAAAGGVGSAAFAGIEKLPNFFDEEETAVEKVKAAPKLAKEGSQPAVSDPLLRETPGPRRRILPPVTVDHPEYSSTMMLLQLTRNQVAEHAEDISAINSILTLPGSIELKRTIAKMFADPKHADEISKMEWERKEKKYQEDRNRQLHKQAEQLKKEREILKQELENLKT